MRWLLAVVAMTACGSKPVEPRHEAPPPPPPPADAPPPVDAPPVAVAPPRFDPATLPELPVTDRTSGRETEVIATDAPVDRLFSLLWRGEPVLAAATGKRVRGRLVAPSPRSAALAILATTGTTPALGAPRGKGALVSLQFGSVPQREILRLLGETLHASVIVGPSPLPDIDIVYARVPADAAIQALAGFDGLAVSRVGSTYYLLPQGTALPSRPQVASTTPVSLVATDATPQIASAVIAALEPFPLTCATTPLRLQFRRLPPAEAARAIAVASGAAAAGGACTLEEVATFDPTQAKLAAIATAGTRRAAVVLIGGVPKLVRSSPTIQIFDSGLAIGDASLSTLDALPGDPQPADYAAWRADAVRVAAVIRHGSSWAALVETTSGRITLFDPARSLALLETRRVAIGPFGIAITDDAGRVDTIPLR